MREEEKGGLEAGGWCEVLAEALRLCAYSWDILEGVLGVVSPAKV